MATGDLGFQSCSRRRRAAAHSWVLVLLAAAGAILSLRGLGFTAAPSSFRRKAATSGAVGGSTVSSPRRAAASVQRFARGGGEEEGDEAIQEGDSVEAVFPDDGEWYSGAAEKITDDGSVVVRWDDPDGGPETSVVQAKDVKKIIPRTPVMELVVGSKKRGVVRKVLDFGAFVDIGADRDGLVRTSSFPHEEVKEGPFEADDRVEALFPDDGEMYPATVTKVVSETTIEVKWDDPDGSPETAQVEVGDMKHLAPEGPQIDDEVDVWVQKVSEDRLLLSMQPPPDLSVFLEVHPEEWLEGKIVSIMKFGYFVSVAPSRGGRKEQGLVHISNIKDGFVEDPWAEGYEVGQDVRVRVTDVDVDVGKLSLSMRD